MAFSLFSFRKFGSKSAESRACVLLTGIIANDVVFEYSDDLLSKFSFILT